MGVVILEAEMSDKDVWTDICVVHNARYCPMKTIASSGDKPRRVLLRYVPQNRPEILNIDLDTTLRSEDVKKDT